MYRHGDVLIVPVVAIPTEAKREKREGDIILALGEATGHAHRIKTPGVVTFVAGEDRYIQVEDLAELSHEEHATIALPKGAYRVTHQRVYVPGALPERVVD
jgi:hypothetical protein